MRKNRKELLNKIIQFENENEIESYVYNDIYLWPFVRIYIASKILETRGIGKNENEIIRVGIGKK